MSNLFFTAWHKRRIGVLVRGELSILLEEREAFPWGTLIGVVLRVELVKDLSKWKSKLRIKSFG